MMVRRKSIFGIFLVGYLTTRLGNNMSSLEKNTREHKIFDPIKAKAQIDVYKEIYNLMEKQEGSGKWFHPVNDLNA